MSEMCPFFLEKLIARLNVGTIFEEETDYGPSD